MEDVEGRGETEVVKGRDHSYNKREPDNEARVTTCGIFICEANQTTKRTAFLVFKR
jgi:hypothetical protein